MIPILLFSAQAPAAPVVPSENDEPIEIIVTAARTPQDKADAAASATVVDHERIERLGYPLLDSVIRLTPSAAVSVSGPSGSFTEVRIRGAEANHTLLFIDGIRANDPAAGNMPRFELLNADLTSSLEVVRGPQSALWGSEAIGGVIAVNGLPEPAGRHLSAEIGANGFRRSSVAGAVKAGTASLAGGAAWQRASGIDSLDGQGDKDGYDNFSGRFRGSVTLAPTLELGLAAFTLNGRTEYDGVDLITFVRSNTLDVTRNRLSAGGLWLAYGRRDQGFSGRVSTSLLGSSNRNLLEGDELNRTRGRRWTAVGQLEYRFRTGGTAHTAIVALDHDREEFRARDLLYGGASDQDRSRTHDALTAQLRTELAAVVLDAAVRHDRFNRFKDSTTVRASALIRVSQGFSVAASYGEGIAQPSFFDLYGFFPGNFLGNPSLKAENSRGFEGSLRYKSARFDSALTVYRQRLHNEIVPSADFSSTVNRDGTSHRSGVEAELGWRVSDELRLAANYTYLQASEPDRGGVGQSRELRRPKHSGSVALDGARRRLSYGGSIAFVGRHYDQRDIFPYDRVALNSYWLAGARVGYRVTPQVELFARASNAFDARYQDLVGYRTEGRALFAGIRLSGGR